MTSFLPENTLGIKPNGKPCYVGVYYKHGPTFFKYFMGNSARYITLNAVIVGPMPILACLLSFKGR